MNNYLIAVLSTKHQTQNAYAALAERKLPTEKISILGQGYQSADEFGLIDPTKAADQSSNQLATWVVPFGFVAGFAFSVLTGLQTFAWAGEFGNHAIGGFLGAASGLMGSWATGRLSGWTTGSGDAIAYRNRLNAGKYIIITQGTDETVRRATQILRQFQPENLQGYVEPA